MFVVQHPRHDTFFMLNIIEYRCNVRIAWTLREGIPWLLNSNIWKGPSFSLSDLYSALSLGKYGNMVLGRILQHGKGKHDVCYYRK
nr:hypothetical protein Iba_chr12dCG5720 [Ipomoea batatas]